MTWKGKLMIALAVVAAQASLVGVYFAVESERTETSRRATLTTEAPKPGEGRVDRFSVTLRDGSTRELPEADRPVLVHFWATWCPPCLDELPLVLELPGDGYEVLAVALDEEWDLIDQFVENHDASRVVRASPADASEKFEVSTLPQTLLVAPDGRILLRAAGARDWSDPAFRKIWETAAAESLAPQGRQ